MRSHAWDLEGALLAYYYSNSSGKNNKSDRDTVLAAHRKVLACFDKYKDPDSDIILIDGTLAYLEDLGIAPEHCWSLTLAYFLQSPHAGEFHRDSFVEAWMRVGVTSIPDMTRYIEQLHQQLTSTSAEFAKLYAYVFGFVRGPDRGVKTIDYKDAVSYWRLLFPECAFLANCTERLEQWYQFVEQVQNPVSRDLWDIFLRFVLEILCTDPLNLSSYDEMSVWHSMMDEYVEWLQENNLLGER